MKDNKIKIEYEEVKLKEYKEDGKKSIYLR